MAKPSLYIVRQDRGGVSRYIASSIGLTLVEHEDDGFAWTTVKADALSLQKFTARRLAAIASIENGRSATRAACRIKLRGGRHGLAECSLLDRAVRPVGGSGVVYARLMTPTMLRIACAIVGAIALPVLLLYGAGVFDAALTSLFVAHHFGF